MVDQIIVLNDINKDAQNKKYRVKDVNIQFIKE
jgi:hypothetical protein